MLIDYGKKSNTHLISVLDLKKYLMREKWD